MNCEPKKYRGLMIATIVLGAILMALGILTYPLMKSGANTIADAVISGGSIPKAFDIIMDMIGFVVVLGAFSIVGLAFLIVAAITAKKTSQCKVAAWKPAIIAILAVSIVVFFIGYAVSDGLFAKQLVSIIQTKWGSPEEAANAIKDTFPVTMLPMMICSIVSGAAVIGFGTFECVKVSKK